MRTWSLRIKHGVFEQIYIPLMPMTNGSEAGRIKNHLDGLIAERQGTMITRLNAQDLPAPKIRVAFFNPTSALGSHTLGRVSIYALTIYDSTDDGIKRVIDHEIAHYVQMKRNLHARIRNKFVHPLTYDYFVEGFAVFASSLTNPWVDRQYRRSLGELFSHMKANEGRRPYVAGFARYRSIAKWKSTEYALEIGLRDSIRDWKIESRTACQQLGVEFF